MFKVRKLRCFIRRTVEIKFKDLKINEILFICNEKIKFIEILF